MKKWKSLSDVFQNVPEDCLYVILRSYEKLHEKSFPESGKDIDVLCERPEKFLQAINAEPQYGKDDGLHYAVSVDGHRIPIDIMPCGVGYYCAEWEKHMLNHRRLAENGKWYVLEEQDYCFSLLYHVLLHKPSVSEKDIHKCEETFQRYDRFLPDHRQYNKYMVKYMRNMKYRYTVPVLNGSELYVNKENFYFCMAEQKTEYVKYYIKKHIQSIKDKIRWIIWRK